MEFLWQRVGRQYARKSIIVGGQFGSVVATPATIGNRLKWRRQFLRDNGSTEKRLQSVGE